MDDKVLTFSLGTFGVIVTRKMMLYAALVITSALAIYAFVLVEASSNHEIGNFTFEHNFVFCSSYQWYYMVCLQSGSWSLSLDEEP
jgi:hypothetical protein